MFIYVSRGFGISLANDIQVLSHLNLHGLSLVFFFLSLSLVPSLGKASWIHKYFDNVRTQFISNERTDT